MVLLPSLEHLRTVYREDNSKKQSPYVYVKQSRDHGGLVHTKLWERITDNNRHTLRIDAEIAKAILRKTGPHGRKGGTRGRPASGIRHLIRREIMLLLNMELPKLAEILMQNPNYKSGKKRDVTLLMPDLSLAINELYQTLVIINPELQNHVVFKRMWAPCVCRLVELVWLFKREM